MKKLSLLSLLGTALVSTALPADQTADYAPEARQQMIELGKRLKGELQSAMQAGGPTEAIGVCNIRAPAIAQEVSSGSDWAVRRTSLKLRNPENRPDDWELMVLEDFEARKATGEDPKTLEYSEIVDLNGDRTFRYMKAIPTEAVCLICHGINITPETSAKLKALYPEDQATGFNLGDIRGAFTLKKKL